MDIVRALEVGFLFAISLLPLSLAYRLARQLGRWQRQRQGASFDDQKSYMQSRMRATEADAERWITRSCELKAIADLECWLYRGLSRENLHRIITFEGVDNLSAALARGRGAVLFGSHNSGGEHVFIGIGLNGNPVKVIVRAKPRNPGSRVDQWFFSRRIDKMESSGNEYIETHPPNPFLAAQCANALRKNQLVGVVMDTRSGHPDDIELEFLNELKAFSQGSALMARASGAPLIDYSIRRPDAGFPAVIRFGEPIYVKGDPAEVVRIQAARIEDAIRQDPAVWSLWADRFNQRRIRRWLRKFVPPPDDGSPRAQLPSSPISEEAPETGPSRG